ncbi:MAG TPA: MarR family transcriptional regulator [Hanamia sp.]
MAKTAQKAQKAREFAHLSFELRDLLRQFLQKKFRENDIELTYEMQQVMSCLWKTDGIKQQELADRTLKDKASLTGLIHNLEKRKFVKRMEDMDDRRSKLIFLTVAGKKLGEQVQPWLSEMYSLVSENVDINAINVCMEVVRKMVDNLRSV